MCGRASGGIPLPLSAISLHRRQLHIRSVLSSWLTNAWVSSLGATGLRLKILGDA